MHSHVNVKVYIILKALFSCSLRTCKSIALFSRTDSEHPNISVKFRPTPHMSHAKAAVFKAMLT